MDPNSADLNDLQTKVLDLLRKNTTGITRGKLQQDIFVFQNPSNDRAIRRAIAELRERGFVITSASDHAGYMLTTDREAVKHYLNESIKRAKKIMRTARKVRQAYGLKDQMSLIGGAS